MTARELFVEVTRDGSDWAPLVARLQGSYRFDLGSAGSFHLRVSGGRIDVRESHDEAACVLRMSEDDLIALVSGQGNLLTAVLQGRVEVQGSILLAEALHAFLRAVEQRRRERAAAEAPGEAPR
jgi:putative sterol carrier protein